MLLVIVINYQALIEMVMQSNKYNQMLFNNLNSIKDLDLRNQIIILSKLIYSFNIFNES